MRLLNQQTAGAWVTGRLEVFIQGAWGQVCGAFTRADADVACRQLGLGTGTADGIAAPPDYDMLEDVPVSPDVALIAPSCSGREQRLLDCPLAQKVEPGDVMCKTSAHMGPVIGCVSNVAAGTEGAFRMTNMSAGGVPGSESGVLEVFHAGAWGTICTLPQV